MQIVLLAISIIILLAFLLPILDGVFNLATIMGAGVGVGILVLGIKWLDIPFTAQKYLAFCLIFGLIGMWMLLSRLKNYGKRQDLKGDLIIVLGCRVKGDVPSLALQKRVDQAFYFLQNNPNAIAILSGGQGPNENLSEAECMKNMLVDRGISSDRLFLEELSRSTAQNLRFSKRIMDENSLGSHAVICTSEYHQLRAGMLCRSLGIKSSMISSKTKAILLPTFLLRELMAIIKEYLFQNR